MTTDFVQALMLIGEISVACMVLSPLLVWVLSFRTKWV